MHKSLRRCSACLCAPVRQSSLSSWHKHSSLLLGQPVSSSTPLHHVPATQAPRSKSAHKARKQLDTVIPGRRRATASMLQRHSAVAVCRVIPVQQMSAQHARQRPMAEHAQEHTQEHAQEDRGAACCSGQKACKRSADRSARPARTALTAWLARGQATVQIFWAPAWQICSSVVGRSNAAGAVGC